ncbi:MAG TPA: AAA family ATPase [Candidatus Polarisedimenticolaceae bacterium]|nr:AAA family ATPase [Candidatus Polarisedimenticolaceae bacterium]
MPQSFARIVQSIKDSQPPHGITSRIVALDGPGASGKSTLARRLAKTLGAPTIQTDDFASQDNPLNWWPQLLEQVLVPLAKNREARYQRYAWDTGEILEKRSVAPSEFIMLEGVTSSREAFRPYLAFSIWVETPRTERLRRGLKRDRARGDEARPLWETWMAEEDNYVEQEHPREKADVIVDGTRRL